MRGELINGDELEIFRMHLNLPACQDLPISKTSRFRRVQGMRKGKQLENDGERYCNGNNEIKRYFKGKHHFTFLFQLLHPGFIIENKFTLTHSLAGVSNRYD